MEIRAADEVNEDRWTNSQPQEISFTLGVSAFPSRPVAGALNMSVDRKI